MDNIRGPTPRRLKARLERGREASRILLFDAETSELLATSEWKVAAAHLLPYGGRLFIGMGYALTAHRDSVYELTFVEEAS